jgi:hypothetical protein
MAENLILVELKAEGQQSVANELDKVAQSIDEVGNEFTNLNKAIELSKKKLSTMNEGSAEFKKLQQEIKASEIAVQNFGKSTGSLKSELKGMKAEIANLSITLGALEKAGHKGTDQFKMLEAQMLRLRGEAGELEDTLGDVSDEVRRSGSDTSGLDKTVGAVQAVGGAFQAVMGVQALFGSENEDLQKTLVKLNAVMAITTGAQQFFSEALKKDSLLYPIVTRLQQLWSVAIGTSTGALRVLRVALAGVGIGLIIAGVVLLVKAFNDWGNSLTNLTDKQKILKDLSNEVAGNVAKETTSLTGLLAILRDENTTRAQKNEALKQIRAQYPEYLGQLTLENLKTQEGIDLITKQIDLLTRREQVKKLVEQIADLETKLAIKPDVELGGLEKIEISLSKLILKNNEYEKEKTRIFNENIKEQTTNLKDEIQKRKTLLTDLLKEDTAGALLNKDNGKEQGKTIGKNIKSGVEKEVVGAFDALQKKISEAEKLLQNLKTEQVEGTKDNVIQIKSLIIELEHYKEILDKIQNYELSLNIKAFIPQIEQEIEEAGDIPVRIEPVIGEGGINPQEIERAKGRFGELGGIAGKSFKDKAKDQIGNLLGFERGDDAKIKAEKTLNTIGAMENGITNIINQASAIRSQNEIAELENKKKRGLISEKKYQEELSKIKRKEAERQKRQAIFEASLNIPLAVLSGFKSGGLAGAIVAGVLATAQLAIVASTPLPKFRHGGLIGGNLHENGGTTIEAERGEFVMKKETVKRFGVGFMKDINNQKIPNLNTNGDLKSNMQKILNNEFSSLSKKIDEFNLNFQFMEMHLKESKMNSRMANDLLKQIANNKGKGYA